MNQDKKNFSRLFYLDQKCLDTLATLIQEQNEANQNTISANQTDNSSLSLVSPSAKDLKEDKGKNDPNNSGISLSPDEGAFTANELPLPSTDHPSTSEDLIVISDINDMRKVCPILAALSKEIEVFLKDIPEVLEGFQKETTSLSTTATTSFASFQKECSSFLLGCIIDIETLNSSQKSSWSEIAILLRIITDYPQSQHEMDAAQSLRNVLDVTDRILKKSPRYANQTAEMSTKDKIILSEGEVFQFMEKIVRTNTAYEAQRLQKSNDIKESNLEILLEISNARMENQSYHMDKPKEDKIRAGIFVDLVDKAAKSRLNNQEWVSLHLQKEKDIDIINDKLNNADPISSIKQVYVISEFKEMEMEISKVVGALEKTPRLAGQESLSKEELMKARLTDVTSTLEKAPKRYDDQTALRSRRKTEGDTLVRSSKTDREVLVIDQILPSSENLDPETDKNAVSQESSAFGDDSSAIVARKPSNQRRSTISNVMKDFGQKVSVAFNYSHSPVNGTADNVEQRLDTEGKKLEVMSLGEMLSSAPKSSKPVNVSSDPNPTPNTSKSILQKSDHSLKTERNNQAQGIVGKIKSLVKSTSFPNKSELDLLTEPVEKLAKPKPASSSKGFIKAFISSFSSSRKNSRGEVELNCKPIDARRRSKSEIPKSKSMGSENALAEVLSANPSSDSSPMKPNKLREITEDVAEQKEKDMSVPQSLNRMALFSGFESTDTIDLKDSERRAVSPVSPVSPLNMTAIQPSTELKRKESRLRTSVNQEELDKEEELDKQEELAKQKELVKQEAEEISDVPKIKASPKKTSRSLSSPKKGETSRGKQVTQAKGNAAGFVAAYLHLNPVYSSGSTLPDLGKDDFIDENIPISEDEKAKSTPASRLPTSTEKASHGSGSIGNRESKIYNILYTSHSADDNFSS